MSAPARFRQEDVTRALRGAEKAGFVVGAIEIDPNGRIVIVSQGSVPPRAPANPWDTEL